MGVYKDLTGSIFNRWKVINRAEDYKSPSGRVYIMWNVECQCGNISTLRSSALTSKSSSSASCGCLSSECTKERASTHRMSNTPTYTSYQAMLKRCNNPNDPSYNNYGGRGIKVCDRWSNSFENFLEDMGHRPENKSLDRVDNNGNYEKDNCKWSSKSEQQLNRRVMGKTSKFRGVTYSKMYKVFVSQVSIHLNGKKVNKKIGNFKTEEEAALAYDKFIIDNELPNKTNGLYERN